MNSLEEKEDLNLHYYKYIDDDIGQHLFHINRTYKISFGTTFFGRTLFSCILQ